MAMNEDDFRSNNSESENSIEITQSVINSEKLQNFDLRKSEIQKIINDIVSKNRFMVKLNMQNINVTQDKLERFIIEIIPRLKEIGASITITQNNILTDDFIQRNGIMVSN